MLLEFFKSPHKNRTFQIYEFYNNFESIQILENSNKFKGVIIHHNNHYISISYKNQEYKYLDSQKSIPIIFKKFKHLHEFCKKDISNFLIFPLFESKRKNYLLNSLTHLDDTIKKKYTIQIMDLYLLQQSIHIDDNFRETNFFEDFVSKIHNHYAYSKHFIINKLKQFIINKNYSPLIHQFNTFLQSKKKHKIKI